MNNPTPVEVDPAEIIRHMATQRDQLLQEADADIAYAAQAREQSREAAERALQEGVQVAENYERRAAERRAYAEQWNTVISREEQAAGLPSGTYAAPAENGATP